MKGVSADVKTLRRIDFDSFAADQIDTRSGRSLGKEVFQRFETLLLSTGDHLHTAVRKIDCTAAKAQLTRDPARGVAKKNALDTS